MSAGPRRRFLSCAGALLALRFASLHGQAPQHARVGFLSTATRETSFEPFVRRALRDIGWVEGRNLQLDARFANGQRERLPELAGELVRLAPHVLIAGFTAEAKALQHATRAIPIVAMASLDPVGQGLAQSLARPGGNVTGVMYADPSFTGKSFEILKAALPRVQRVALLYPTGFGIEPNVDQMVKAGTALSIEVHAFPIAGPGDVEHALNEAKRLRVDALRISSGGPLNPKMDHILLFAKANSIPTAHSDPRHVERGGLLSYTPLYSEVYTLTAALIDKILKGAKPAELPFTYPTRYELIINQKTARQLGILLPQSLLARADRVIE